MEGQPTVLLIEDEKDTVLLYKDRLTQDGLRILVAPDIEEGLRLTTKEHPDLVLLDLMLPGRSGFDYLDTLRADPKLRSIPVLALTNLAEEVGFERAMERGAVGYIVKSERTPRQVSMLIKQILRDQRTHKKNFRDPK